MLWLLLACLDDPAAVDSAPPDAVAADSGVGLGDTGTPVEPGPDAAACEGLSDVVFAAGDRLGNPSVGLGLVVRDWETASTRWALTQAPSDSAVTKPEWAGACGWFTPDVVGRYELKVVFSDASDVVVAREYVTVRVSNAAIEAGVTQGDWSGSELVAGEHAVAILSEDRRTLAIGALPDLQVVATFDAARSLVAPAGPAFLVGGSVDGGGALWEAIEPDGAVAWSSEAQRASSLGSDAVVLLDEAVADSNSGAEVARLTRSGAEVVATHGAYGDLDGDGVDDLVVYTQLGSTNNSSSTDYEGQVSAMLGPISGTTSIASADWVEDRWGHIPQLALGDVDGDGYAELWRSGGPSGASGLSAAAGSATGPGEDVVYLHGYTLDDALSDVRVADVTGDGAVDVVVDAAGHAWVFEGPVWGGHRLATTSAVVVEDAGGAAVVDGSLLWVGDSVAAWP